MNFLFQDEICDYIQKQSRRPKCSENDAFCTLATQNFENLSGSCQQVCIDDQEPEICKNLVLALQYNTKLLGQDGHGIFNPELVKQRKLELENAKKNQHLLGEDGHGIQKHLLGENGHGIQKLEVQTNAENEEPINEGNLRLFLSKFGSILNR